MTLLSDVPLALRIAFARPWTFIIAMASMAGMAVLLAWSSGLFDQRSLCRSSAGCPHLRALDHHA